MVMRVVRVSNDALRRVWADHELTLDQAAARLDISVDTLRARAARIGLPTRRTGRREVIRPHQERDFAAMWRAGIAAHEIGQHFGCSYFAVINTARRLNLPMRGAGYRPKLRLQDWQQARLAQAMARAASATEARHRAVADADRTWLKEVRP